MKNVFKLIGVIALVAVIGFGMVSCGDGGGSGSGNPSKNPTYTVWTDSISYSEFQDSFGTLDDGYYFRFEFTSSDWNTISPSLTNEGKHNWTESEIKNWFIGRGFGNTEANQETAWLMTINHGFIGSRSGSIVYMILK